MDNLFWFMVVSCIADLLALILLVPYWPSFHGHTEQGHLPTHSIRAVQCLAESYFSKERTYRQWFPLSFGTVFPNYGNVIFSVLCKKLKNCRHAAFRTHLPALLFSKSTSQGPDTARHGLMFSLPLTLLLADEKHNWPSLVTSADPAPGPTSDLFLESEPFEERLLVNNVLIMVPVVVHIVTQKPHLGQCLGFDTQTL